MINACSKWFFIFIFISSGCFASQASQLTKTYSEQLVLKIKSYTQRHITQPPKTLVAKRAVYGVLAGAFFVNSLDVWGQLEAYWNDVKLGNIIRGARKPAAYGAAYFFGGAVGIASYGVAQTATSAFLSQQREKKLAQQKNKS